MTELRPELLNLINQWELTQNQKKKEKLNEKRDMKTLKISCLQQKMKFNWKRSKFNQNKQYHIKKELKKMELQKKLEKSLDKQNFLQCQKKNNILDGLIQKKSNLEFLLLHVTTYFREQSLMIK
ncbi:unnamed protein product [Paramecium sonneborni]|uniref:Uncharacterized protein n=1 Tax=Paramecium sonneborni TaxID=65129 RepID=A0A8S1KI51_9CILI|nr:unnamed protein product [Paramecium sonneborni]